MSGLVDVQMKDRIEWMVAQSKGDTAPKSLQVHQSIITEKDPNTGTVVLVESEESELQEPAQLTSTEVSNLTGIAPPIINHLRKEGLLSAERPTTASESKRDGYLYRQSDVEILKRAQRLGMGRTFIDSVRVVREQIRIKNQTGQLLGALCSVYKNIDEQNGVEPLVGNLRTVILNLDTLTDAERAVLLAAIDGNFPKGDSSMESLQNRRRLERAYAKVADMLFTVVRLAAIGQDEAP